MTHFPDVHLWEQMLMLDKNASLIAFPLNSSQRCSVCQANSTLWRAVKFFQLNPALVFIELPFSVVCAHVAARIKLFPDAWALRGPLQSLQQTLDMTRWFREALSSLQRTFLHCSRLEWTCPLHECIPNCVALSDARLGYNWLKAIQEAPRCSEGQVKVGDLKRLTLQEFAK